ncbi:MAG TPA: acyl carrier protein [Micromonosporaceae bacterium]
MSESGETSAVSTGVDHRDAQNRPDPSEDGALAAVLRAGHAIFKHPVTPEDNFFDLGGNSLAAFRLITMVTAAGYRLHVEDVFDQPDMRSLAATAIIADRGDDTSAAETG